MPPAPLLPRNGITALCEFCTIIIIIIISHFKRKLCCLSPSHEHCWCSGLFHTQEISLAECVDLEASNIGVWWNAHSTVACCQREEVRSSVMRGGLMSPRKVDTHARLRNKRKPPRGMYLSQESLMSFATTQASQADAMLKKFDAELVELKRQVGSFCGSLSYHVLLPNFCVVLLFCTFCLDVCTCRKFGAFHIAAIGWVSFRIDCTNYTS